MVMFCLDYHVRWVNGCIAIAARIEVHLDLCNSLTRTHEILLK